MASPAVSTPESAGSPAPAMFLAPAPQILALKPVISASSPLTNATPSIVTQKEWVIPPRPKPGRKPATDTPPTKRKAQNRAAQRAFRERRAARVGELEEQLDEEKVGYEKKETELLVKAARLEEEVRRVRGEVERWRVRCYTVEGMLEWERAEKERVEEELKVLRFGSQSIGTEAVPLPLRRNQTQRQRQQSQVPEEQYPSEVVAIEQPDLSSGCGNCTATSSCACIEEVIASVAAGCGKCSSDTHCECSEVFDSLDITVNTTAETDLKRPHSRSSNGGRSEDIKRQRQSEPTTPLEIDFTAQFSRPRKETSYQDMSIPQHITTRIHQIEPCGFCKEGDYCACADMAASASANRLQSSLLNNENRLPPLLHEVTPPPSDSDVTASDMSGKLPVWQPKSMHRAVSIPISGTTKKNSCVNGPGTCEQCLSDPKSGMFCRSLAKLKEQNGAVASGTMGLGCCGGNGGQGGCCMDKKPDSTASQNLTVNTNATNQHQSQSQGYTNPSPMVNPPPTLSCAQAYQTLSTHSAFDRATDSSVMGDWLGRLNATSVGPNPAPSIQTEDPDRQSVVQGQGQGRYEYEGRGPLEVEAASVMEVLKFFDRRFGRG